MASLRRDLLSAYTASATKIFSWVAVSAMVYRILVLGTGAFAMLALVRSTIGLLNYTSLGLAPALIHFLARLRAAPPLPVTPIDVPAAGSVLPYSSPSTNSDRRPLATPAERLCLSGLTLAFALSLAGAVVLYFVAGSARTFFHPSKGYRFELPALILSLGGGTLFRIASDASGAVLQAHGRIFLDNLLLAASDIAWVLLLALWITPDSPISLAGTSYLFASMGLFFARLYAAERTVSVLRLPVENNLDLPLTARLLSFGSMVTLSQLADFLYAPTDFLLINHLIPGSGALAAYAPAVQIDAALLVLVAGLSSVLLPRAALAHAAGDLPSLRRYYVRGTLASLALLIPAALLVWLLSPLLFHLWLGTPPAGALAILPLVLLHTVIGGSSAVGRSVLLGTGRVKPFTASVLVAGISNVVLSYCFVQYLHLGLVGIVLGTIVAVTARCALWLPWYTLRSLRSPAPSPNSIDEPLPTPLPPA